MRIKQDQLNSDMSKFIIHQDQFNDEIRSFAIQQGLIRHHQLQVNNSLDTRLSGMEEDLEITRNIFQEMGRDKTDEILRNRIYQGFRLSTPDFMKISNTLTVAENTVFIGEKELAKIDTFINIVGKVQSLYPDDQKVKAYYVTFGIDKEIEAQVRSKLAAAGIQLVISGIGREK